MRTVTTIASMMMRAANTAIPMYTWRTGRRNCIVSSGLVSLTPGTYLDSWRSYSSSSDCSSDVSLSPTSRWVLSSTRGPSSSSQCSYSCWNVLLAPLRLKKLSTFMTYCPGKTKTFHISVSEPDSSVNTTGSLYSARRAIVDHVSTIKLVLSVNFPCLVLTPSGNYV